MSENPKAEVIARLRSGDARVVGDLFEEQRARLVRMIGLRLDAQLKKRVDASDVIQEAFLEASVRLPEYLEDPRMPFSLWLRFIASQKLMALHRHHLGVQGRDARREIAIGGGHRPEVSTASLSDELLARDTSPTHAAKRSELQRCVEDALASLDPIDREVIVLRHFEQLSNEDAAVELGLEPSATSKRFVRALLKLKEVLSEMPGGAQIALE